MRMYAKINSGQMVFRTLFLLPPCRDKSLQQPVSGGIYAGIDNFALLQYAGDTLPDLCRCVFYDGDAVFHQKFFKN